MKRVDNSNVAGNILQDFKSGTLQFLQDIPTEILQVLIQALSGIDNNTATAYVLYGCVNSTPGGGTFTISAGVVYYNGKFYYVPAATLTPGGGQVVIGTITENSIAGAGYDPTRLSTGALVNVHFESKIILSNGTTGSGTADYSAFSFLKTDSWVLLPYETGWINGTGVSASRTLWFRKDATGFVYIRGKTVYNSGSNPVANIPAGFRPLTKFWFSAIDIGDQSMHNATIDNNGDIIIEAPVATHEYTLSGIIFFAEN